MDSTFDFASTGLARRNVGVRVLAALALAVLAVAAFVLMQRPAGAAVAPQFTNIVCPILQSIFAAFQNSPFFAFIKPILNALLAAFGCGISG